MPARPTMPSSLKSRIEPAGLYVLPLSARHPTALAALAHSYADLLSRLDAPSLQDVCYSAGVGRVHHSHRVAVVARVADQMVKHLRAFAESGRVESGATGKVPAKVSSGPVFVFTGMGPQWPRMGLELVDREPVFRQEADAVDREFRAQAGWSILDEMRREKESSRMSEAEVAQPANFLLQAGLAALLRSWGLVPAAIVGHSAGEVAAAYVAGVHDLRDAVRVIYHRSRLQQQATGMGRLLAVGLSVDNARALIAGRESSVAIAAHNGPRSVALSGSVAVLDEIATGLERDAVFNRFVQGHVPYHSPHMDALKPHLRAALADVRSHTTVLPLYSSVTALLVENEPFDAEYWCDNIRKPVLFAEAIERMLAHGHTTFLEVGPHPVLGASITEVLRQQGVEGAVLATLRRGEPESASLRAAVASLYVGGQALDWRGLNGAAARRVKLPTYPWQRERLWFAESPESIAYRRGPIDHPLLGTRVIDPEPAWEAESASSTWHYLQDHTVDKAIVFPGAGYVELGLAIHGALETAKAAVVEDLEFRQALVIAPGTQQFIRSRFNERTREYSVYSRRDDDTVEWVLHARGRIAAVPSLTPRQVDLTQVRQRCEEEVPRDSLYARLADLGLQYGPSFQRIERLWRADGEAVAQLTPLETPDLLRYRLHPTVIDGSIQCLVAAVRARQAERHPYLPVSIERVTWFGRTTATWWSHVRVREQSETLLEGDVVLCDAQGSVLAELLGVRCQVLASERSREEIEAWTYRPEWVRADRPAFAGGARRWLLCADRHGYADQLARQMRAVDAGVTVDVVDPQARATGGGSRAHADAEFSRATAEMAGVDRVVCLWPLDDDDAAADPSQAESTGDFMRLVQAIVHQTQASLPRLYVVTKGAQSVDGERVAGLAHTPVIGLARTVLTEYPDMRCTVIDLDAASSPRDVGELASELLCDSPETETALRHTGRYVCRLARFSLARPALESREPTLPAVDAERFCLQIGRPGRLNTLRFHEVPRQPPGRHEVEIRILAAGLNFKDVLKATGFLPSRAVERTFHLHALGMEASGLIARVGEGVEEYHVGDPVVISSPNSFSSHVTVPVDRLFAVRKLDAMSFVEAASVPVTFMTAYYALHELARLRTGETVLIHAAAGGVGLAALQVAKWLGATVIATAGSPDKRAYVQSLGVEHVLNSRTLDFADEVMALTRGRGVDVVLNSLAGEALRKSVSVVAPLGRFIEIGKRDIIENDLLPMLAFNRNLSLIAIDLDRIMAEQPDRIRGLLASVWERFRAGDFTPTPMEVFPAGQIADAFRRMAESKQIGKIVISFEDLDGLSVVPQKRAKPLMRADASYMITGGCGGFGLEIAKWMASEGARHLVLTGRTGARTPRAQQVIQALVDQGVDVTVCSTDVSDEGQLRQCLADIGALPPLRGIVHAAGVLDDALLLNLDGARLHRVMAPKARGAWLLHAHTQRMSLDFFALFSSVSSLVGTPGQGSYVAANAYLDALAHHRRAMGLPATSINWGALADVGMAAENAQAAIQLGRSGITPFAPAQAVRALALAIEQGIGQFAFVDVDWQKWHQACGAGAEAPRFANLVERDSSGANTAYGRFHAMLASAAPQDRSEIAALALADVIAETMRISPDKIDVHAPFTDMGIDSLTALELQTGIETRVGVRCSVFDLQKADGVRGLAERLVSQMGLSTGVN